MLGKCVVLALFAAAQTAAARGPQEEFTRNFEKNLTLQAGQSVRMEHRLGNITIRTQPGREVRVNARIHVSGTPREEAARWADAITIHVEQAGAGVFIHTEYPEGSFRNRNFSYAVDYDMEIGRASCRERV